MNGTTMVPCSTVETPVIKLSSQRQSSLHSCGTETTAAETETSVPSDTLATPAGLPSASAPRPTTLGYEGSSDVSGVSELTEEVTPDEDEDSDSVIALGGGEYLEEEEEQSLMEIATEEGRRVIQAEADCLNILAAGLSIADCSTFDVEAMTSSSAAASSFGKVVELMRQTIGRVVVTGVGKSGIIGKKIAATLSSTGTPAIFVHSGDAAHGDLGMIHSDDVVLAISKSGESSELAAVIQYCQRCTAIPLIAMTQKRYSTLGRAAKYHLLLPNVPEACHLNVAPTTSSTATLALGDALAVALSRVRGFSLHQFGSFHPGGNLGRLSMRIDTVMHKNLPLCPKDTTTIGQALIMMATQRRGCIGIVQTSSSSDRHGQQQQHQQRQQLVGIITPEELEQATATGTGLNMSAPAHTIMSPCTITADPRSCAQEVLHTMNKNNTKVMFVTHPLTDEPIGVIHQEDLLGKSDSPK